MSFWDAKMFRGPSSSMTHPIWHSQNYLGTMAQQVVTRQPKRGVERHCSGILKRHFLPLSLSPVQRKLQFAKFVLVQHRPMDNQTYFFRKPRMEHIRQIFRPRIFASFGEIGAALVLMGPRMSKSNKLSSSKRISAHGQTSPCLKAWTRTDQDDNCHVLACWCEGNSTHVSGRGQISEAL